MSAFLVKNLTISKLAEWLIHKDEEGGYFKSFKNNLELARALYNLNVLALEEQYQDYQEFITPFKYTEGVFLNDEKGKAQAYMSLCCFLYQCSAGTIPSTKLYKKLEEFEIKMAKEIALDWAEKQGAVWD